MKKRLLYFLLPIIILFCFGCGSSATPFSKEGFYLDTVISITLYDQKEDVLLDECFALCQKYEELFSRTIPTSDISRINQAKGQPVEISRETADLIQTALSYCETTEGAFDITTAPLSDVWDFKNNTGTIPSSAKILAAKNLVDYHTISLKDQTICLANPDAAIDLGAIAKGYIADRIKEYLISQGVTSALINLGGNVLTIGAKPDGTSFHVGIQKPFSEKGTSAATVELQDESLVTSGVYERYFEIDGTIYHHILNPKTGYPYENHLLSVTILSPHSVDGDALSTSCFALGLDAGRKLIDSLEDIEAIFITDDNQIHDTRKGDSF